jgi:hypothetical protein
MLFMLLTHHNDADVPAGHMAHHDTGAGLGPVPLVAILLAGYFGWHALRCTDAFRVEDPEVAGGAVAVRVGVLRSVRTAAVAHVVMAVAMTVMLLAMI